MVYKKKCLKEEVDHEDVFGDSWEDLKDERLSYLKIDVLSLAFLYARYAMNMSKITRFGMEDFLSLSSLKS